MKIIPLSFIWCISFVCACISVGNLDIFFWISFVVFSCASVYVSRHKRKLSAEIDIIFGSENEFND